VNTKSKSKAVNPFYVALVVAGIAFAITACAYGAMSSVFVTSYRELSEQEAAAMMEDETTWMNVIDRHGMKIMLVEIGLLTVLTVAAISTDSYWTRGVDPPSNTPEDTGTGDTPPGNIHLQGDNDESEPLRER